MNTLHEINKRKEYQAGLLNAFEMSLPDDLRTDFDELIKDEEVSAATKETLQVWRTIVGPFVNTLAYIVNNRLILENLSDIILDDSDEFTMMFGEDMFDVLQQLNKATAKMFIATVKGRTGCIESLYGALLENDKKAFISLLRDTLCDATPLARLCRSCWEDVRKGFTIKEEEFSRYLEYLSELPCDDDDRDGQAMHDAAVRLQPDLKHIQDLDDSDFDDHIEQYFKNLSNFNDAHFRMCVHFYQDSYEDFKPNERQLLDGLLQQSEAQAILVQEEMLATGNVSAEEIFDLPKDYFNWEHTSNMPTEHLYMNDVVRKRGTATFVDFINYLADMDYIEDHPAVKTLLAYRLTGRCRPEGKLPKIEWRRKDNKPYELIYIIKSLSERGDYKKMRRFFTGPEWANDSDGSYAKSASRNFQRQMAEFYPEACKVLI